MTYYADFNTDLPSAYRRKRVIFYRQGLKIYGLLPYILQRKLKAQFYSSAFTVGGGRFPRMLMSAGSFEANWTVVPYQQSPANIAALLDWLYAEKGFEVAVASAEDWDEDICSANWSRTPPETWYPLGGEARGGFLEVVDRPDRTRSEVAGLLLLAAGTPKDTEGE